MVSSSHFIAEIHGYNQEGAIGLIYITTLCCVMTPGLTKDIIRCHESPSFFYLQITSADIRPQVKWVVNQVIAHGHFKFSSGVCVCKYGVTPFITPEGGPHFN